MRNRTALVLVGMLLAIIAVCAIFFGHGRGKPLGRSREIDFAASPLAKSELVEFLGRDFTILRDVQSLPGPVLRAFTEVGGSRPVIANPGQRFEAGDVITDPSVPQERLLFAGVSGDRCFVHYEQGGFAHTYILTLFHLTPDDTMKPIWKGYCGPAKDVQGLRSEIENDHCR